MNYILKLLNNQLELNDRISSYDSWASTSNEVFEDEKGQYKIRTITHEVPCSCHPETCCHFDGKTTRTKSEKIYL